MTKLLNCYYIYWISQLIKKKQNKFPVFILDVSSDSVEIILFQYLHVTIRPNLKIDIISSFHCTKQNNGFPNTATHVVIANWQS